jgi:predicted O-methyltransferase YrrM
MVCALMKPKRVLELGSGVYSTKEFLKCPTLKRLTSLETDEQWLRRLRDEITDERLTLRLVEDTVAALPKSLTNYDLVFVDNADNPVDREAAIRAVLGQEHPVVIVHDAENLWYRHAINELAEHYVLFDEQVPNTAVIW